MPYCLSHPLFIYTLTRHFITCTFSLYSSSPSLMNDDRWISFVLFLFNFQTYSRHLHIPSHSLISSAGRTFSSHIHKLQHTTRFPPPWINILLIFRLCLPLSPLAVMGCETFITPLTIHLDLHHIQSLKSPHTSVSAPDYRKYGSTDGLYFCFSSLSEYSSQSLACNTTSIRPKRKPFRHVRA